MFMLSMLTYTTENRNDFTKSRIPSEPFSCFRKYLTYNFCSCGSNKLLLCDTSMGFMFNFVEL